MPLEDQSEASFNDSLSEKYESEMAEILEELKKDANVGKAIDRIIEEADELGEMQSKLILLIKHRVRYEGVELKALKACENTMLTRASE